jgi:hypothetical protein
MFLRNRFAAGLCTALSLGSGFASGAEGSPQQNDDNPSAVSEAQKQHAKELYQKGVAAYRAGQFSEAIDKLLDADRVMPNAAFSYNIALAYQAMGDERSALRWLRGYLRQSTKKDEKAAEKVRVLEAELQAKGLQQVTVLSKPGGATLRIDGSVLGLTPFTTEIVPGSHYVTLTLDGYKTVQKSLELRPERSVDVDISLEPAEPIASTDVTSQPALSAPPPSAPPAATERPQPAPPADSGHSSHALRPLTWASVGVGTALLGGSVVFELMRASAEKEARAASQADYPSDYDKVKSRQTVARVLAITGGVVLTTGIILLTVDLTRTGPVKSASIKGCGTASLCTSLEGSF